MAEPLLLGFGLFLGFLFFLFMIFGPLPMADKIVKKNRGICEAWLTTRLCCLLIAMPFYFFIVWMMLVIVVEKDKGISVIEQICPDDYLCTRHFALGRENHDKSVCQSIDCGEANIQARSGSKPIKFDKLGLGQSLSPKFENVTYTCDEYLNTTGICNSAIDEDSCVSDCEVVDLAQGVCAKFVGCDGDIEDTTHVTECLEEVDSVCIKWTVAKDSRKQFGFQACACESNDCATWECSEMTMQYYYPNILYAGAVTILMVLPLFVILYVILKTHIRKILKCGDKAIFSSDQATGYANEVDPQELIDGGYGQDALIKKKYKTFTPAVFGAIVLIILILSFLIWTIFVVSGRVGLSFVCLAAVLIALQQLYKYARHIEAKQERFKMRTERAQDGL